MPPKFSLPIWKTRGHNAAGAFRRMEPEQTASLLLQEGDINVTQAALSVGYTNLSNFANAFKARFGMTPGEFLQR